MKGIIDRIVKQSKGKFMTVTFLKNDGTPRKVNGRIGVRFNGVASDSRYDSQQDKYFLLWECRSRSYKRVSADRIMRIASEGVVLFDRA